VSKVKCQRKTESSILTVRKGIPSQITMANHSVLWGYRYYPFRKKN